MGTPLSDREPGPGLFVALEGCASVDTPAVARETGRRLRGRGMPVVDFDGHHPPLVSPTLDRHLATLSDMTRRYPSGEPEVDLSDDHWVYLRLAWHTALAHNVIEPLLDAGHIVLVDTWTATFLAHLSLRPHINLAQVQTLFDRLIQPDAVIHLCGTPAATTGHAENAPGPAGGACSYEERVAVALTAFAREGGWRTLDTTGLSIEAVAEKVAFTVQNVSSPGNASE